MRKIITLDEQFPTGEATVQPVLLWGPSGRPCYERVKIASEASEYIKSVEPRPGKSIVLVLGLGSYETYDLNRNGDGFNERPYRDGFKPTCGCCEPHEGAWVSMSQTLLYHYQSFGNAKNYRHHVNKDPLKAVGDVIKPFWNPTMHRIELLVGLENSKAPDLAERIAAGEYPPVSMGCRIKYDVCTICGHQSPTRAKYCDHLKFHMRQVMPNGLRAGALNPDPDWFDISWVVKPADQTGYMLKKVAHESAYEVRTGAELGEYMDAVETKSAAIQKLSDIDKVVRGIPVDHKSSPLSEGEEAAIRQYHQQVMPAIKNMPEMDDGTIKQLAQFPVAEVLSTLSAAGVILTTPEFIKLLVEQLSPGTKIPEEALDAVVALQGHVFDFYAKNPQALDQVVRESGALDIKPENVNPAIGGVAAKYLEKRSTISEYLSRALVSPAVRAEEPPFTDVLHVHDPSTGDAYETTRGAAAAAHDEIAKRQLLKMVGGGALLAGGYKLLAPGIPSVLRPLAVGTAGLLGYHHLKPDFGPQYMSDEGVPIPALTELHKSGGELENVALPILGSAGLVAALGHDYDSRLRRGLPVGSEDAPIYRQLFDKLEAYHHDHPALAFMTDLATYGAGKNLVGKFSSYMGEVLCPATDSVVLPEVNVDRAAEKLGSTLLR